MGQLGGQAFSPMPLMLYGAMLLMALLRWRARYCYERAVDAATMLLRKATYALRDASSAPR